ncbi:MAG TPA: DUF4959 domain-containing protein, partial [Puia sp.]|nr:DUF4959 domain-containing protein [Puia sp.]
MKKKILYTLCALLLLSLTQHCKKNNDTPTPQNVQNISVAAGYGEADFSWTFPRDSSFLYVSVSYKDSSGKTIENKFSRFTDTAIVGGLQNRPYVFTVKTVTDNGVASTPQTLNVTPLQTACQIVAGSLSILPDFGSVQINWSNSTGKLVGMKIQYTDSTGTTQVASASSSASRDSTSISGLKAVPGNFTVTVLDAAGNSSVPVALSATPYAEVQFVKQNWQVIDFDSQETSGEGPNNGFAKYAIDDNIKTYWHTEWQNAQPPYPHYITIDMGQPQVVSRIEIVNRQGHKDGMTQIQLLGSSDNSNWTNIGTFPFQQINAGQFFPVSGAARNMR